MSWTNDLLDGLAEFLDDAGAGTYRPDSTYQVTEMAITLKGLPDTPDRAAALSTYPVQASGSGAEVVVGLQVRTRGAPDLTTDPDDLADAIYEVLHGVAGTFGGITVPIIWHQSGSPLGPDESGRWQRSDNYYLRAAHGTDSLD